MKRLVGCTVLAIMLAGASGWPVALVYGSTVQGSAVQISGLDDLSATTDQQARKGAGKILAMLLGMGGLASILGGRIGLGLSGVGAGLAMGFVPGMVSSAFDNAPASTADLTQQVASGAWWAPFTAGLYPGLLLLKFLQDPVFLACLAALVVVMRVARAQRASTAFRKSMPS